MSHDSATAVAAIQQTLSELRSQCDAWQRECDAVVHELDSLQLPQSSGETPLAQLVGELVQHHQQSERRQDEMAGELASVHSLVRQQVELFSTLVTIQKETARQPGPVSDPTAEFVSSTFEALQQAARLVDAK